MSEELSTKELKESSEKVAKELITVWSNYCSEEANCGNLDTDKNGNSQLMNDLEDGWHLFFAAEYLRAQHLLLESLQQQLHNKNLENGEAKLLCELLADKAQELTTRLTDSEAIKVALIESMKRLLENKADSTQARELITKLSPTESKETNDYSDNWGRVS